MEHMISEVPKWVINKDKNEYRKAHINVRSQEGPARDFLCVSCGERASHWAWQWKTNRGSMSADSFDPMCVGCHLRYDMPIRKMARTKESIPDIAIKKEAERRVKLIREMRALLQEKTTDAPYKGPARVTREFIFYPISLTRNMPRDQNGYFYNPISERDLAPWK